MPRMSWNHIQGLMILAKLAKKTESIVEPVYLPAKLAKKNPYKTHLFPPNTELSSFYTSGFGFANSINMMPTENEWLYIKDHLHAKAHGKNK